MQIGLHWPFLRLIHGTIKKMYSVKVVASHEIIDFCEGQDKMSSLSMACEVEVVVVVLV